MTLFAYWGRCPPEHIATTIILRTFTNWEPAITTRQAPDEPFRESNPDELKAFAGALTGDR